MASPPALEVEAEAASSIYPLLLSIFASDDVDGEGLEENVNNLLSSDVPKVNAVDRDSGSTIEQSVNESRIVWDNERL